MYETVGRRTILRGAVLGTTAVGIGVNPWGRRALGAMLGTGAAVTDTLELTIRACLVEMADLTRVPMWAFDSPQAGLRVPGPVIHAVSGREVTITVTNTLDRPHRFAVPGVVDSGPIDPGVTGAVTFTAPVAGTYLYHDPTAAPISRAMGLAGALVVLPAGTGTTPYDEPTRPVADLFDDLGTTTWFPGHPWVPSRSWCWMFSSVDPVLHARALVEPDLPAEEFAGDYLPTYFMLNGRTGFFASNDPATVLHGRVGQPALIRIANLGLVTHSPHIHGNHIYVLATDGEVRDNVIAPGYLARWSPWRRPTCCTRSPVHQTPTRGPRATRHLDHRPRRRWPPRPRLPDALPR